MCAYFSFFIFKHRRIIWARKGEGDNGGVDVHAIWLKWRVFLGLRYYCDRFIPNLSKELIALYKLMKKHKKMNIEFTVWLDRLSYVRRPVLRSHHEMGFSAMKFRLWWIGGVTRAFFSTENYVARIFFHVGRIFLYCKFNRSCPSVSFLLTKWIEYIHLHQIFGQNGYLLFRLLGKYFWIRNFIL